MSPSTSMTQCSVYLELISFSNVFNRDLRATETAIKMKKNNNNNCSSKHLDHVNSSSFFAALKKTPQGDLSPYPVRENVHGRETITNFETVKKDVTRMPCNRRRAASAC